MPRWAPPRERFLQRIVLEADGCWRWTGATAGRYGVFTESGRQEMAYRVAFRWVNGWLPSGHRVVLDHLCRNPLCVNPQHLEAVTQRENCRRGQKGATTHCPKGHEYTPQNTYRYYSKRLDSTMRKCRRCHRERERIRRANTRGVSLGATLEGV